MVMGSGSILLNQKLQNGLQGSDKKKSIIVVSYDSKSRQKLDSSISHIINALNLITYINAL